MVVAAPKCRLCQHAHWSTEPHVFDREPKQVRVSTFRKSRLSNALDEDSPAPQSGTQLVLFDRARVAIDLARSVDEVKRVRDQAQAIRLYFRQAKESLEMQNKVAEIKLRAERRIGEMLPAQIESQHATLSEIGISKSQSSRWQMEASVSEEEFERYVAETGARQEELTSAGLLRLGRAGVPSRSGEIDDKGRGMPEAPVSPEQPAVSAAVARQADDGGGLGSVGPSPASAKSARQSVIPVLVCPQCSYAGPRSSFRPPRPV